MYTKTNKNFSSFLSSFLSTAIWNFKNFIDEEEKEKNPNILSN